MGKQDVLHRTAVGSAFRGDDEAVEGLVEMGVSDSVEPGIHLSERNLHVRVKRVGDLRSNGS